MRHFSILQSDDPKFGNFCWPSIARLADGRLVTVASGFRMNHVDPFGKVVASVSEDDGKTWSEPKVLIDSPLDDRDAGILPYGDGFLLISFTLGREELQFYFERHEGRPDTEEKCQMYFDAMNRITDEDEARYLGSTVYYFDADFKEQYHVKMPITSPHGPTLLRDGRVMLVGRTMASEHATMGDTVKVYFSRDGKNFDTCVDLDLPKDGMDSRAFYCEPHCLELADGTILVQYRLQYHRAGEDSKHFTIYQSVSTDGGKTFSPAAPLNIPEEDLCGSPPHLIQMKDGTVVLTYGYRLEPYGQRARISRDSGKTWSKEMILRDDGISWDLGYPATVELKNGNLLSIYYQIPVGKKNRAILATEWHPSEFN